MKRNSLRLAVHACLIAATLTGCGSDAALKLAAEDTGRAAARVTMPDLPDDCRKMEPHAALSPGAEARSVLKRERGATDRANARVGRCAGFYDDVKTGVEGRAP